MVLKKEPNDLGGSGEKWVLFAWATNFWLLPWLFLEDIFKRLIHSKLPQSMSFSSLYAHGHLHVYTKNQRRLIFMI